jgi:uncharacterized repeat protein (TIGR01451 family)
VKWFAGALVLLAISLVFDLGLLAYAMYVLLAVMLVSRWISRAWCDNLAAQRECNTLTAEVGQSVAVVVNVRNTGRLPIAWVLMEDLLPRSALLYNPPSLGVKGSRLQLASLRRGAGHGMLYQLECNRRGYYQIGPLVLETGDVFGLHRRYRVATEPHYLLVYPRVVPLEGYEVSSRRPIGEVRMAHRLYEDPTRISGVRQYEPGDPLNRINWRATARTGILHSKVYEPSSVAGATLVLDFHQASYAAKDEPYRSDLAVTAAVSIANAVYLMNQQIGLVSNGRDAADRIRCEGPQHDYRTRKSARAAAAMLEASDRLAPVVVETRRGPEQFMRIREALARLELTDGFDLPSLLSETHSRLPRDATVIVILSAVTDQTAIALGNLRRQGYAVTAVLNLFEDYQYSVAAGRLLAEGIDTRHLKDEQSIVSICRRQFLCQ